MIEGIAFTILITMYVFLTFVCSWHIAIQFFAVEMEGGLGSLDRSHTGAHVFLLRGIQNTGHKAGMAVRDL